jgi:hypothetical protein
MSVKFGAKPIELENGKAGIAVPPRKDVLLVFRYKIPNGWDLEFPLV